MVCVAHHVIGICSNVTYDLINFKKGGSSQFDCIFIYIYFILMHILHKGGLNIMGNSLSVNLKLM